MTNYNFLGARNILRNARIKYIPDEFGNPKPYELIVFSKATFLPAGWELSEKRSRSALCVDDDEIELLQPDDVSNSSVDNAALNRLKSFNRAKNMLFDYLVSNTVFDAFITLTVAPSDDVDRYNYDDVIKKLGMWLDNRVRRNGLIYVIVPEYHKDKAIHFHGLCNFSALKTERAISPRTGRKMKDNKGRSIYNISDYALGYSTAIKISGPNAREATAKYCFKYITKTNGQKVGGRYYLSGGDLQGPKYKLFDMPVDRVPSESISVANGLFECRKIKLNGVIPEWLSEYVDD